MAEKEAPKIRWELAWIGRKPVGAAAIVDKKVVAVVAFYDDADANRDGKVSTGEWLVSGWGTGELVTVANILATNPDLAEMDSEFFKNARQMFVRKAGGLVLEGIYAVYFSRGVGMGASSIAKVCTKNVIAQFALRKGTEKLAKEAFEAAVNPGMKKK